MRPALIVMTVLVAAALEGWASAQPAATRPATAPATTTVATTTTAPAAGDAGEGVRQGKVGEAVESAGVTLTIVRVSREPEARWKDIIHIAEDEKYVDLEILLENKTGDALKYYPSAMKLKDSEDQEYGHDAMVGVGRALEFGSIPHGQRVRGHLSYTLPKAVRGLRFTYSFEGPRGDRSIYINLPDE